MGSIKQTYIKRIGRTLKKTHKERFGKDFEKNKTGVNELIEAGTLKCESKGIRNRLAGYLTKANTEKMSYKPKPKPKTPRFSRSRYSR